MMEGRPRTAFKVRSVVAALTGAAHVLFVLLLWLAKEPMPRATTAAEEPEGVWIQLTSFTLPPSSTAPAEVPQSQLDPPAAPQPATPPVAPALPRPPTAITLPPGAGMNEESSPGRPAAAIDWHAQAGALAARRGEELAKPVQETFSPPPKVLREACKPPESSFKWKTDDKSTGSAALTLGWEPPPPNTSQFDDMMKKKGQKPTPSVPDPDVCD